MFAQQRFTQHHGVPRHNIGTHRQTVDRGRLNDRQLAQARHRHLQRPWDRCRRQRQHMHVGLQRFQLLLMIDAEPLFFVNNDQAKPFEFKRLCKNGMRSHHYVQSAIRQGFTRLRGFGGWHEP